MKIINTSFEKKHFFVSLLVLGLFFFGVSFANAMSLEVEIPSEYSSVGAGDRLGFEVVINYPENIEGRSIDFFYEIKKDGIVVSSLETEKVIESKAFFIDFVGVPDELEAGMYELNVEVSDFEDIVISDSVSFKVIGNGAEDLQIYFLSFFGFIIVSLFVFVIARDLIVRNNFSGESE